MRINTVNYPSWVCPNCGGHAGHQDCDLTCHCDNCDTRMNFIGIITPEGASGSCWPGTDIDSSKKELSLRTLFVARDCINRVICELQERRELAKLNHNFDDMAIYSKDIGKINIAFMEICEEIERHTNQVAEKLNKFSQLVQGEK